jgi:hypothetical protein
MIRIWFLLIVYTPMLYTAGTVDKDEEASDTCLCIDEPHASYMLFLEIEPCKWSFFSNLMRSEDLMGLNIRCTYTRPSPSERRVDTINAWTFQPTTSSTSHFAYPICDIPRRKPHTLSFS